MISANIPNSVRKAVYRRDGYRCALCDSPKYIQIHHAIPRSRGGGNTPHNLICLCADCHAACHGMDLRNTVADGTGSEDGNGAGRGSYLADLYAEQGETWDPWEKPVKGAGPPSGGPDFP